jgi:tetratricopeptide (TPR) repeat protein
MILEEWVGRLKRMKDNERLQGWQDLRQTLAKADADKRNTLVLRLHRVLLFDPDIAPSERQRIRQQFSIESSLAAASPAVLQSMLDLAKERKDAAFALRVARYMIATYTETDYALDARMVLAKDAIEAARASPDAREVAALQAEAVKHLEVVREVFATTSTAGDALVLLGQLYIDQKKYDEALKSYKAVLEVKEWRPLWPEALYGCGEVTMAQREYQAASAYYERIYIMYLNFRAWSAKAYLRRADCLRRLHQDQKAREVLADMVARPELADLPETKTAKDLLAKAGE